MARAPFVANPQYDTDKIDFRLRDCILGVERGRLLDEFMVHSWMQRGNGDGPFGSHFIELRAQVFHNGNLEGAWTEFFSETNIDTEKVQDQLDRFTNQACYMAYEIGANGILPPHLLPRTWAHFAPTGIQLVNMAE